MKRDMDLLRRILAEVEATDGTKNYETPVEAYHAALAKEGGLLHAEIMPEAPAIPMAAFVYRLTWAGHDFLDATKDEGVWKKVRESVLKPGVSFTFSVLQEILKAEAQRQLRTVLGLPA